MPKCPIALSPCDSTRIKEFGYDAATQKLALRFHGKSGATNVYVYDNVPPEKYASLQAAHVDPEASVGKWFGEHLKDNKDHPFTKIDETAEAAA